MPRPSIRRIPPGFDRDVFINCPFDDEYLPLFHAVVFTVLDMGFRARCALEASNAGNARIEKIMSIVAECKYSIHDLSRTQLDNTHQLPRFNMPLELGIDLGCKRFGQGHEQEKVILIMDIEPFRYQRFISDIAGQDVYDHGGTESGVVQKVREWLRPELNPDRVIIPGGPEIIQRLGDFQNDLPAICTELHWDADHLAFADYTFAAASWIEANPL